MKKYRTAIIGCGNIASLFDKDPQKALAFSHAGAYSLCPQTELIAACDVDAARVKDFGARWKVAQTYTDYKEMLCCEDIDILSVCTPPKTHAAIVCEAAKIKGIKAIYCEKPIALNTVEANKMVKACASKKILLMINHQRRFGPFWREVKAKFDQGFLGEIQQVTCYYTRGIYNTGVHIIDLFSFLFGQAVWVKATLSKNKSPFPQDPNMEATIGFKSGLVVSFKPCDDAHYLILEMDMLGSKGRLKIGSGVEYFSVKTADNLLGKNELKKEEKLPFKSSYGPLPLTYGVQHIINCLEKKEKPLSDGKQAIQSINIIEAILKSAQQKKTIYLGGKHGA